MTAQESVFTDREPDELSAERPFRPSAIVALILGLLSGIAVFSWSLFFIPVAGILCGLFAMRPGSNEEGAPAGRVPASIGLILSMFFLGWSYGFFQKRANVLEESGTRFAVNWLEILGRGETAVALQLTKPPARRQMSDMSLDDYYSEANQAAYQEFREFLTEPTVGLITSTNQQAKWEFVRTVQIARNGDQDYYVGEFHDTTGTFPNILVTLSRYALPPVPGKVAGEPSQWFILNTTIVELADDRPLG